MAEVWKARDLLLNRTVVIKSLHVRAPDDALAQRFVREARVLAAIDDPHIVKIYDVSVEPSGQMYDLRLITQFLDGLTLQQYLAARPRPSISEVVSLARQLCEAIAMVHGRGLVHRDLKPANLMLCPHSGTSAPGNAQSRLVLIDFGIARPLSSMESSYCETGITQHGYFVGTPAYAPPELFTGAVPSVRSDLYSIGCILFEAIAGRGPFPEAADFTDYVNAHRKVPIPSLRIERPDVPVPLDDLVRDLLAKSPADRPTGTAEVLARLEGAVPARGATRRQPRPIPAKRAETVTGIEDEFRIAMSVESPDERTTRLEELLRSAVDALSADHRITWLIALNLGRALQESGTPDQAVSLLTMLRTQLTARLPAADPIAVLCRLNLARYTGESGRPSEAAAQLGELLASVGDAGDANNQTLLEARFDQAHWCYVAGDFAAARALFDTLLSDHVSLFGSDGDETRTLRRCLSAYPALQTRI